MKGIAYLTCPQANCDSKVEHSPHIKNASNEAVMIEVTKLINTNHEMKRNINIYGFHK